MMGTKGLRALVVAGAAVLALGTVGVAGASAMPLPGPNGSSGAAVAPPKVDNGLADGRLTRGEHVRATVNGLRVRTGPGTGYGVLGQLYTGDRMKLIGKKQDSGGQSWYRVVLSNGSAGGLPGGYVGWVVGSYLY
ncbi:SH3 domain-containing protein [Streptomyces sp. NPDC057302]|uniref:SH3 domain-containing protein n=1 Tax=Streptomyces sp. NPDC057302 TaxID=3346094 RepID=UPI003636DFC1